MCELMGLFNNDLSEKIDIVKGGYALLPNAPDLQVIIQISAASYERNECKNKNLAFIPSFYCNGNSMECKPRGIFVSSELQLEYSIDNVRLLRKMLQPIDDLHCLVFGQVGNNRYRVIGICSLEEIQHKYQSYIFTIKKHMKWYLRIGTENILGYENGQFKDVSKIENQIDIEKEVLKIKETITDIDIDLFGKLLRALVANGHGTSLIVFKTKRKAKGEAERLSSKDIGRGFLLDPVLSFNAESITQITDIDGGLIFDKKANCYAYGCIFDGKVPTKLSGFKGNSARGSRYNSIKLYVETTGDCVGVIYSDDGTIDVIP